MPGPGWQHFAGAGIPSRKIGCRELAGIVKIANILSNLIFSNVANWNNSATLKSRSHRAHIALTSRSHALTSRSRRALLPVFRLGAV